MQNLLDPAILFFGLGILAGLLRSNLEVPESVGKFLSLYLLMALGLKGGFALAASPLDQAAVLSLLAALTMAVVVPALGYVVLKRYIRPIDAAAVAASFGSVSAVTFVTAASYLDAKGWAPAGHMTVAMVLMETPAIILAVSLAAALRQSGLATSVVQSTAAATLQNAPPSLSVRAILVESLTHGSHVVLVGALAIGWITGSAGQDAMQPFVGELFKGLLAFFLLDMGLRVARHFPRWQTVSPAVLVYALAGPLVHAALALGLGRLLGLGQTETVLLMVLSASASYIVVPAALRQAMPEANPALYLGLSLGVTFPFNMVLGIPLYAWVVAAVGS